MALVSHIATVVGERHACEALDLSRAHKMRFGFSGRAVGNTAQAS